MQLPVKSVAIVLWLLLRLQAVFAPYAKNEWHYDLPSADSAFSEARVTNNILILILDLPNTHLTDL